jgi:CRISPR-associated protein Cmr5
MVQQSIPQSRQRSLEQQRAGRAWECVKQVKDRQYAGAYRSLARGATADLQANGLGQTLAFWRAKGYENGRRKRDSEHAVLLEHVSDWLRKEVPEISGSDNVVEWIATKATTNDYRRATVEAIAFLNWVKRFAEAELPASGEEGG